MELERERHDSTWRQPQKTRATYQPILPPVVIEKKETKRERQKRDQVFFDAGRYKEGARDSQAVAAWERLTRGKKNG